MMKANFGCTHTTTYFPPWSLKQTLYIYTNSISFQVDCLLLLYLTQHVRRTRLWAAVRSPGPLTVIISISCAGGCARSQEEASGLSRGCGVCKWFNMRMGFGFLSMSSRDGAPLEQPLDVFVHQVRRWEDLLWGSSILTGWIFNLRTPPAVSGVMVYIKTVGVQTFSFWLGWHWLM